MITLCGLWWNRILIFWTWSVFRTIDFYISCGLSGEPSPWVWFQQPTAVISINIWLKENEYQVTWVIFFRLGNQGKQKNGWRKVYEWDCSNVLSLHQGIDHGTPSASAPLFYSCLDHLVVVLELRTYHGKNVKWQRTEMIRQIHIVFKTNFISIRPHLFVIRNADVLLLLINASCKYLHCPKKAIFLWANHNLLDIHK